MGLWGIGGRRYFRGDGFPHKKLTPYFRSISTPAAGPSRARYPASAALTSSTIQADRSGMLTLRPARSNARSTASAAPTSCMTVTRLQSLSSASRPTAALREPLPQQREGLPEAVAVLVVPGEHPAGRHSVRRRSAPRGAFWRRPPIWRAWPSRAARAPCRCCRPRPPPRLAAPARTGRGRGLPARPRIPPPTAPPIPR